MLGRDVCKNCSARVNFLNRAEPARFADLLQIITVAATPLSGIKLAKPLANTVPYWAMSSQVWLGRSLDSGGVDSDRGSPSCGGRGSGDSDGRVLAPHAVSHNDWVGCTPASIGTAAIQARPSSRLTSKACLRESCRGCSERSGTPRMAAGEPRFTARAPRLVPPRRPLTRTGLYRPYFFPYH